jgi:hypothetical protein
MGNGEEVKKRNEGTLQSKDGRVTKDQPRWSYATRAHRTSVCADGFRSGWAGRYHCSFRHWGTPNVNTRMTSPFPSFCTGRGLGSFASGGGSVLLEPSPPKTSATLPSVLGAVAANRVAVVVEGGSLFRTGSRSMETTTQPHGSDW